MPDLTRRRFLQGAAALGAATVAACHEGGEASPPTTASRSAASPAAVGPLVIVTLAGGNDALNTVAPVADSAYRSARGALALDPATALDVGEGFALHPALVRTKELWDAERLAIVHGVGFPGLDRSHFHCMDVWHAADTHDLSTGWLGRWLDRAGDDPLDAVAVGRSLPLLARGAMRSAAVVPAGPFTLPGATGLHRGVEALGQSDHDGLRQAVARSVADLVNVAATLSPILDVAAEEDTLANRLGTVAALIAAGLPTRVYAVQHDGYDTHAAQAATHQALLAELDAALGAFLDTAGTDVTVLVYSEFGRRVTPNGSGTDHGSAGNVLLAGAVRPGHHGEPPPLDDLVEGDLRTTVDFREVYASLLGEVLATDPADVIPDAPRPLDLV